jgi:hypothetical protein
MATVYCTHVFPNGEIYRFSGETVVVGDLTYVKRKHLSDLELVDRYLPTSQAADDVAAIKIEMQIASLQEVLAKLRPLSAGNQAAASSSAAERAQAVVAT